MFWREENKCKSLLFRAKFFNQAIQSFYLCFFCSLEMANEDDAAGVGMCIIIMLLCSIYSCCCKDNKKKEREQTEAIVNGVMNMADDNIRMQIQMAEMRQRLAYEEQRRLQMEYAAFCMARQEEERRRQAMLCYNRRPW